MKRGRPTKSQIRQGVVEILHHLGRGYGYEISKIYNEVFRPVTQRSVYYHLRKGLQTGEIAIEKREQQQGNFSWGSTVEKTYYRLGSLAAPQGNRQVREFLEKWQQKKQEQQQQDVQELEGQPTEAKERANTPGQQEQERREQKMQKQQKRQEPEAQPTEAKEQAKVHGEQVHTPGRQLPQQKFQE